MALWDQPGAVDDLRTTLPDGTRVLIRPLVLGDAQALEQGFAQLSPGSRLLRFLRATPRLSGSETRGFTDVDHRAHEALGALVLDGAETPAATVRYYLIDPTRAEFALTVVDAFQRLGLGTLMLGLLADLAASRGITRFDAFVHGRNLGMQQILRDLGGRNTGSMGPELEFSFSLHRDAGDYPAGHAGDVFRRAQALRSGADAAPDTLTPPRPRDS